MRTEKGRSINADHYVGLKVKVESARIEIMRHGEVIKLQSTPIEFKGDDKLGDGMVLRASRILGLGRSEEDGALMVIKDSKLHKFLQSKKINITNDYDVGDDVKELIGVQCVVQKTDDGFLELV